jgi:MarR family 2-MHQ and catechol resistance regulon transcriptional repressor
METGPHIRLVLWKAAKAVEKVDKASIAQTGLGRSDFSIMEALLNKGPLAINQIGKKVLLTSGSMTAAINRLEKGGLVKRVLDNSVGFFFYFNFKKHGRDVIKEAYGKHQMNLEKIAKIMTHEERAELVRLLKKMGFHADKVVIR